ncbi:uncharacterized protein LOC133831793 [Humulus lupulus]|uniref:uncharacterized protein LOC133831793 n=1 Tax=Humulus lupulus TaxID=3486 RepID=UPI002B403B20|nr:uncharacterized protein LOC133831793 [Humulus lupulus]
MAEKLIGYPEKLLCPCKGCRNLSHQCISILYEHLVIYGIDPTYKIWFHHGEELSRDDDIETMEAFDSYNLFRATNIDGCDFESHVEGHDDTFMGKIEDADTLLYPQCTKYTKLSSIVALKDKENLQECPTCGTSRWMLDKLTKKENILLSMLIPGPKQPGNNIDIYLEPLVEDLKLLWNEGVDAHDALDNTNFKLRAILMWTIQDFPAYGNLAGCKNKGRFSCPLCGYGTHSEWLKHSGKFSYRGHQKFLQEDHPFRSKRSWFDGEEEHGNPPRIMNGTTIAEHLKDFVNELYVHHKLDVMHIEKNVCESICNTLLDVAGKSKYGLKARLDLQHMGIRSALHPHEKGTRTYLPAALHTLSKLEKELFCKRLFSLKVPDGYSSNIQNFVSMEQCKLMGLKSQDFHILMQQLLSVAIKGLMPVGPRDAIMRLCLFFNRICQRVLDRESIMALENDVIETLCLLERFFPPSFFDVMIHLVVHIGREARLFYMDIILMMSNCVINRRMKILKDYVKNRARPEGRPISKRKEIILTDELLEIAHRYILLNTSVVEPFLEIHLDELKKMNKIYERNSGLLWKKHIQTFSTWMKEKVPMHSSSCDETDLLKWLAYGPRKHAASYTGYIINGQRFHIHDIEKSTQNSGVSIEATTMCRSSAKDVSQVPNLVSYYGVIREIILLDYYIVQIPIFKCDWANVPNVVKVEDSLTLVNLHQSQWSVGRDPFILASQAKQVFYSREHDSSNCGR